MVNNNQEEEEEEIVSQSTSMENKRKSETVFDENKLWIKLKIPKQEDEAEMKNYTINGDGNRVCNFCNKAFSSGKALGGHMRIHVQKKDILFFNPFAMKKTKKKNKNNETTMATTNKPTCIECEKVFPSMKSLFGHMRCHPERLWRGINPPSNVRDRAVDLTESLKRWPVTARRGRRAAVEATSEISSSEENDDQFHEAVEFLVNLANGELVNKPDGQDWLDQDDDHDYKKKRMRKKVVKLSDLEIAKGVASPAPVTPPIHRNPVFGSHDKYRCSTCDKTFPTGQALGGHKSSHNKIKILIHNSVDQYETLNLNPNPNPNPNPTNQMKECMVDSSSGEGCSHTGRRMLAFDLNEAPPTSMDEIGFESDYSIGNYSYALSA